MTTMKHKRRVFQESEPAYRAFLIKFGENKNFDDACIISALEHAFSEVYESKIPSHPDTRAHLLEVIHECKEKILNDLETLKDSPDSKIGPLKLRLRHKKKNSNNGIGKITKKRKLNNADVSQEETTVMSESKENYSNKRRRKRRSTANKNLLTNSQRDENMVTNKVLKVTIENDKNLQNMVKSCTNKSKKKQNQSSEVNTEASRALEGDSNQHLRETNQEENEKLSKTQDHNESIEIEHSILRVEGNDNSSTIKGITIKKEIDLLDNSFQGDILIPLPEDTHTVALVTSNNASSLEVNNQSNVLNTPLVSVNSQENVSSLNIACYNNFIPSLQSLNCNRMSHMNCCPCMYLHHHMNSQYGCHHGMYNFPMMNPFFPHFNHAFPTFQNGSQAALASQVTDSGSSPTHQLLSLQNRLQQLQSSQITENRSMNQPLYLQNCMQPIQENQIVRNSPATVLNALQPAQHLLANQMAGNNSSPQLLNTAQELAKLQTAIFNLNSQLVSLQNAWNQSPSN